MSCAAAERCFMPLTVGGGVRTVGTSANCCWPAPTRYRSTPPPWRARIRREAAEKFGSQCIVAAIDAKAAAPERGVFTHGGRRPTGIDAVEWASRLTDWRRRDPADLDGSRRHQVRFRYRTDPRRRRCRAGAGDCLGGVGTLDHLVEGSRRPCHRGPRRLDFHFGTFRVARRGYLRTWHRRSM